MHFITGGAFNGKSAWVKEFYKLAERNGFLWISASGGESLPDQLPGNKGELIVLEGIEYWIKDVCFETELNECKENWQKRVAGWRSWELAGENRKLIIIGSDITKGIVPVDPEDRKWRDVTGWCFQDITAVSERVDLIWYGIANTIKVKGEAG